jgi:hypothetical protein
MSKNWPKASLGQKPGAGPVGPSPVHCGAQIRGAIEREADASRTLLNRPESPEPEQGSAARGRLDSAAAAIKEPHTKRSLQVRDCLRHRWLGYAEMRRRFGHAVALDDGQQACRASGRDLTAKSASRS